MKLIKRVNHTTEKNGVTTELDILIYGNKIIWYWSELTKFDNGDEMTEDQSFEDYIKNGPPAFASILPAEKIEEINNIINQRRIH